LQEKDKMIGDGLQPQTRGAQVRQASVERFIRRH